VYSTLEYMYCPNAFLAIFCTLLASCSFTAGTKELMMEKRRKLTFLIELLADKHPMKVVTHCAVLSCKYHYLLLPL
jgi:hypothetical protein